MIAFSLSLALFLFWLLIGSALVAALHTRRNILRGLLLGPAVGVVVTVLPVFWLNQLGLPVASFSIPLTIVLLLASAGLLWKRPLLPRRGLRPAARAYLPFLAVFVVALLLIGRPMLEFGFNWLSYENDDMANYVLGAHRFAAHGYFDPPDVEVMLRGLDYPQSYWAFVVQRQRSGSELLLAWFISLTGLTGHQVFMPVILALGLVLISAAGALVCQSPRARLVALVTCGVLGLSALNSFGMLYQLIAQTGGLALLTASVALLLQPFDRLPRAVAIRHGALTGIVGSGLLFVYPEATPFLGLSFVLYTAVNVVRRRATIASARSLITLGTTSAVGLVLVNAYLFQIIDFLMSQAGAGLRSVDSSQSSLFPYYLIPSGLANLWGFQEISHWPDEPWLSTSIALGALMTVIALGTALVLTWRGQPAAVVTLIMALLAMRLFVQHSDFGLFKLAMFIQPFILGMTVVACFAVFRKTAYRLIPLLLLGLLNLPSQFGYVEASRGTGHNFTELHDASSTRLLEEFQQRLQPVTMHPGSALVLDTSNVVLAKFQALYSRGISTQFASRDFFSFFTRLQVDPFIDEQLARDVITVTSTMARTQVTASFPWFPEGRVPEDVLALFANEPNGSAREDPQEFTINMIGQPLMSGGECDYFIGMTEQQNLFNRWKTEDTHSGNFFVQGCEEMKNYLIFTDSNMGRHYYSAYRDRSLISMHQLESDPTYRDRTFVGVGRRMILQVMNPSPGARLVLNMTASYKGDGEARLPPAIVIGSNRAALPMVGRGSARVFSAPISLLGIASRSFVGLDMGIDGQPFPDERGGLMALYGTNVPLDRRLLVGFARDISLISQEEFERLAAPAAVRAFPSDLANPELEYSGVYEDGWVAESSFFGLTQPTDARSVLVRGVVPLIDNPSFTTELRLLVDGQEVARRTVGIGDFEVRAALPPGTGRRRVELQFSEIQRLPNGDGRPTAARVQFVGFEERPLPPRAIQMFPDDLRIPGLEPSGLSDDGWVAATTSLTLGQPSGASTLVARGVVPLIDNPSFTTELRLLVDGQEVARRTVGIGDFEVRAALPPGTGRRRVELQFSEIQRLPNGDGRPTAARVQFVGFE